MLGLADVEWKLVYVGSAEDENYDQILDSVLVGPMVPGQFRFIFQVGGFTNALLTRCNRTYIFKICPEGVCNDQCM